jgi:hypothetical protein
VSFLLRGRGVWASADENATDDDDEGDTTDENDECKGRGSEFAYASI